MLDEFLTSNRDELIRRCRQKAAARFGSAAPLTLAEHGVPLFMRQLVDTLRYEQSDPGPEDAVPASLRNRSDIGRAAKLHGAELLGAGYSVEQVVHDYGDVCQAVTELAIEQGEIIATGEFSSLNRCLDEAIAGAVTAFGSAGRIPVNDRTQALHDDRDAFVAEQRRLIGIAIQSFFVIRTGNVGFAGATGMLLEHALKEMRHLADRTLADIEGAKK